MEDTYTVAELTQVIDRAVRRAFDDQVWVEGEISDLRRSPNQPHVYFTLTDPDHPQHRLRVGLFAQDRHAVNRYLMRTGAVRMTDGVHVRIRGEVGYHAASGYIRLRMRWIDPAHTLGRIETERRALLARLDASGDLARNGALPEPILPLRIGLVTSVGSAAHADFLHELTTSGYGFKVTAVHASVQGASAPEQVGAAIARGAGADVDLVAVVRGGGAQTDLAAFDSEMVARAVAEAPVPVWVGIGHEIDSTVIDHVAARSLKTPTACAGAIVETVRVFDHRLRTSVQGIDASAAALLDQATLGVGHAATLVRMASRRHIAAADTQLTLASELMRRTATAAPDRAFTLATAATNRVATVVHAVERTARDDLAHIAGRITRGAPLAVARANRRMDTSNAVIRAHDPERMLRRGWSVTRHQGRVVTDPTDLDVGDDIEIEMAGGALHGRITRLVPTVAPETNKGNPA